MAIATPGEGEIFLGDDDWSYFRNSGGTAQSYDLTTAFIPMDDPYRKQKGITQGQLASEALNRAKTAGYDFSNVKRYNIGDLMSTGAFKTQQGASGNYFAGQAGGAYQDFFKPLYHQQQQVAQGTANFSDPGYSQIQTVDGRMVSTGGTGGVYAPSQASQAGQVQQINQGIQAQPGFNAQSGVQAPQVAGTPGTPGTPVAYSGNSIVDYLKTAGMPADIQSRGVLATQYGLVKSPEEYVRLAAAGANGQINEQLLKKMRADGGATKIETPDIGDGQPAQADQTYTDTIQANEENFNSLVGKYLAEYGITDVRGFGNNPMMTFEDIYSKAMKNAGLDEAKSLIENISKEISDENNKMAEEVQKIDSNPWISEGLRSKKVTQAREKYENRVQGMNQRLALIQSAYDRSVENVRYGVEQTMKGVYAQYDFQRDLLNRAMDRAEKEIEATRKAKEFDPQRYEEVQGGLFDLEEQRWIIPPKAEQPIGGGGGGSDGVNPQKLTVDQSKARQFAVAAENANSILSASTYKLGKIENPYLPNFLKPAERQEFEQAARAFVNSVLRRESGATITDSEFNNKYKELIPVAGDKESVLAAKEQARAAAVKSITEAGLMGDANTGEDPLGLFDEQSSAPSAPLSGGPVYGGVGGTYA